LPPLVRDELFADDMIEARDTGRDGLMVDQRIAGTARAVTAAEVLPPQSQIVAAAG
jgi:hypothetical protein